MGRTKAETYTNIENEQVKENLKDLIKILKNSDDQLALDFFIMLLSKKESFDIAKRIALLKLLEEGVVQRTIAEDLGVSLCKITRGSSELKRPNSALKKGLSVLKKPADFKI